MGAGQYLVHAELPQAGRRGHGGRVVPEQVRHDERPRRPVQEHHLWGGGPGDGDLVRKEEVLLGSGWLGAHHNRNKSSHQREHQLSKKKLVDSKKQMCHSN